MNAGPLSREEPLEMANCDPTKETRKNQNLNCEMNHACPRSLAVLWGWLLRIIIVRNEDVSLITSRKPRVVGTINSWLPGSISIHSATLPAELDERVRRRHKQPESGTHVQGHSRSTGVDRRSERTRTRRQRSAPSAIGHR